MVMSLLAGGKQVPARQKVVGQAIAHPATPPAKPLEIATPAWLQPILDRLAEEKDEPEKYDDTELKAAIEKLRQEIGPIANLKAEAARQKERADQLQALVTDLQSQLVAARAQPKPQATPSLDFDKLEVIRGADGLTRFLKIVKE